MLALGSRRQFKKGHWDGGETVEQEAALQIHLGYLPSVVDVCSHSNHTCVESDDDVDEKETVEKAVKGQRGNVSTIGI